MFLSRVCLGTVYRAPHQDTSILKPPDGRDSIHGSVDANGHEEFIIYDGNQAYPEYLIEFSKVKH